MKLSTKIRYGVRAILDIAGHSTNRPVPLSEVAERESISAKYLEAIMPSLRAADLLRSIKGPRGGYVLSRPPGEITLFDIVSALEGPASLVDCINNPGSCDRQEACASYDVWKELSRLINDNLRSLTVSELTARQRAKAAGARGALMYNI